MTWGDEGFSVLLGIGYLLVMTLGWLGLLWGAGEWGKKWRLERHPKAKASSVKVSICIPARWNVGYLGSPTVTTFKALALVPPG